MKNKYLVIAVLIVFAKAFIPQVTSAMDSKDNNISITFELKDSLEVSIPLNLASQSETIKQMLKQENEVYIRLEETSLEVFEKIIDLLTIKADESLNPLQQQYSLIKYISTLFNNFSILKEVLLILRYLDCLDIIGLVVTILEEKIPYIDNPEKFKFILNFTDIFEESYLKELKTKLKKRKIHEQPLVDFLEEMYGPAEKKRKKETESDIFAQEEVNNPVANQRQQNGELALFEHILDNDIFSINFDNGLNSSTLPSFDLNFFNSNPIRNNENLLFTALTSCDIDELKLLLNSIDYIDINAVNKDGESVFIKALKIFSGEELFEIVELFLDNGLNLNDEANKHALEIASLHGETKIVSVLLEKMTENDLIDSLPQALSNSICGEYEAYYQDIFNLLINSNYLNANAYVYSNLCGKELTPLMLSVSNYRVDAVKALLDKKDIDGNLQDQDGNTAFMLAIINPEDADGIEELILATIETLLSNDKIDINKQNKKGQTALMLLLERIKELIEIAKTIKLKLIDLDEYKTLQKILKALLSKSNIQLNLQDTNGDTALIYAIRTKMLSVVEELLAKEHIDLNLKNKQNQTALIIADELEFYEVLEKLLSRT